MRNGLVLKMVCAEHMQDAMWLMVLPLRSAHILAARQLAVHLMSLPADASMSDAIKAGITMRVL